MIQQSKSKDSLRDPLKSGVSEEEAAMHKKMEKLVASDVTVPLK